MPVDGRRTEAIQSEEVAKTATGKSRKVDRPGDKHGVRSMLCLEPCSPRFNPFSVAAGRLLGVKLGGRDSLPPTTEAVPRRACEARSPYIAILRHPRGSDSELCKATTGTRMDCRYLRASQCRMTTTTSSTSMRLEKYAVTLTRVSSIPRICFRQWKSDRFSMTAIW